MPVTTIAQFQSALDTYGVDLAKWPPEQRAQATVLLAGSAEARTMFEAARGVDALLRQPGALTTMTWRTREGMVRSYREAPGLCGAQIEAAVATWTVAG